MNMIKLSRVDEVISDFTVAMATHTHSPVVLTQIQHYYYTYIVGVRTWEWDGADEAVVTVSVWIHGPSSQSPA